MHAPPAPLSKGAARDAPFRWAGDTPTGPSRLPAANGTRAPTAAFLGFRSHRLRATTRECRNEIGQHRAHQWTHVNRGHRAHFGLTTAQGNNGRRSLCLHASQYSNPCRDPSGPATARPTGHLRLAPKDLLERCDARNTMIES